MELQKLKSSARFKGAVGFLEEEDMENSGGVSGGSGSGGGSIESPPSSPLLSPKNSRSPRSPMRRAVFPPSPQGVTAREEPILSESAEKESFEKGESVGFFGCLERLSPKSHQKRFIEGDGLEKEWVRAKTEREETGKKLRFSSSVVMTKNKEEPPGKKLLSSSSQISMSPSKEFFRRDKDAPSSTSTLFLPRKKRKDTIQKSKEKEKTQNKTRKIASRSEGDLMLMRNMAKEFYESVAGHFRWFEPGFSDYTKEFYKAYKTYVLPSMTSNHKKKMSLITRYLVAITELLGLEMRGMGWMAEAVLEKADKIGRIEDIQYDWVIKAEQVWRSSQWVKILNKMAQESNVTLVGSEVEAMRELFKDYLRYLKGASDFLRKEILEKVCFFLIEHLCTHSLDPCNLFVGSIPSAMAMERMFVPFKKEEEGAEKGDTLHELLEKGWRETRKSTKQQWRETIQERNISDSEDESVEGSEENVEMMLAQRRSEGGGVRNETGESKEDEKGSCFCFYPECPECYSKNPYLPPPLSNTQKLLMQEQEEREDEVVDFEKQPLPLSREFFQALVRWNCIKDSPDQVAKEIDSLLSLLSPSVTCPAGWYVAVNVSSFRENREWFWNKDIDPEGSYKHVLFRLAEPLLSSDSVAQIFLDCLETRQATVPVEDLLYYQKGETGASLKGEKNCKSGYFGTPLSMYFQQIQDLIKREVADFIRDNGAKHDPSCSAKLNYNGLEELCRDRMILENVLGSSSMIPKSVHSLVEPMLQTSKFWASQVPPMLFPPPRLMGAFGEIVNFVDNLPSFIENEFRNYLSLILMRISTFKKRGADLKSGELKNDMCRWWLKHIGTRVDDFLTEQGYVHDTLPDDYLNTPPTDMAAVLANRALLGKIMEEEGEKEGKYGVEKLVEEVVGEVYEQVDSLKEEMEFLLEKKWVGLPLEIGWEEGGGEGDVELEEGGEIMERDHEYLVKMKEMDEEIAKAKREGTMEKKKLELSDVVPMAGLVMARFHVHNCELNTAIDHWQTMEKMGELPEKKLTEEGYQDMGRSHRLSEVWKRHSCPPSYWEGGGVCLDEEWQF